MSKADKAKLKKRLKKKFGLPDETAGLAALYVLLQKQPERKAAATAKKTVARLERLVKEAKKNRAED